VGGYGCLHEDDVEPKNQKSERCSLLHQSHDYGPWFPSQDRCGVWQWWGLEAFVFMSSYVSTAALAATSVLRAISQFTYMIPFGLRLATIILIGKKIGEMSEPACRHFYNVSLKMGLIYAGICALLFAIFGRTICMIFTQD
jgi:Na+-driven multidrug efflux pump